MPGQLISTRQKEILKPILEGEIVPTTMRPKCSVNLHGEFFLHHQTWQVGNGPAEETVLGLRGPKAKTGEPSVHFHVDWQELKWIIIDRFELPRINTTFILEFCTDKTRDSRELWFYVPDGNSGVEKLIEQHGLNKPIPFGH